MKLLLSHIADVDGVAPVILMNLTHINFEYKLFDVEDLSDFIDSNIDSAYFDKYDEIYITDLGIKYEVALKIENSKYKNKFKLFDHHESHYYLNDFEFATVKEVSSDYKECGTTLFYKYLKSNYEFEVLNRNIVKHFIELVRENDTWDFTKYKKDSKSLSALFDFYGIDKFIEIYTSFLTNNDEFKFSEMEEVILSSLNRKMNEYLESMKDKVIIKSVDGYNIGFVFAERYRSELGNYLAEVYESEVDFICIINLSYHISFRGIKKDKPTNIFSSKYGGGGHPLASAMPLPKNLKNKIITYIFGEEK